MDSDKPENIEEGSASEGARGGNGSVEKNSHVTYEGSRIRPGNRYKETTKIDEGPPIAYRRYL